MNVTSTGDCWVHNEIDVDIQITRTIGVQNQLVASYDRKAVVGKNTTNMRLPINLAFSPMRGEPEPQYWQRRLNPDRTGHTPRMRDMITS